MKRRTRCKLKWKKIISVFLVAPAIVLCGVYASVHEEKYDFITYRKEVRAGDTLWGICSSIVTDKEDVREVVRRTMKDNGIVDPGRLQPGREIIITVRYAK